MMALGIDPGSKVTGYALLDTDKPETACILDAGRITGSEARVTIEPPALAAHWNTPDLTTMRRIRIMAGEARYMVHHWKPDWIVIEVPSGKIGTGAKQGARGSLATYGMATGVMFYVCYSQWWEKTIPVTERQWTANYKHKRKDLRQIAIAAMYPQYDPKTDPGGDVADAIGAADWWINYLAVWQQEQAGG